MMSSFTTRYTGISNVLKNKVQVAQTPTLLGSRKFTGDCLALWDTGATCSVITQKIVDELNLKPTSYGRVSTANGDYETPFFYVDVLLPNKVIVSNLLVPLGQPSGCDLLIGMDIIAQGDFAVSNFEGKTVFTYRIPSSMEFDFVSNTYKKPVEKTGTQMSRNSVCSCGSGKKYKNCCGKG